MKKKFTIQRIIEAAEQDGYPWRGNGVERVWDSEGQQQNFCVLEQTSINLGIGKDWSPLADALNRQLPLPLSETGLGEQIWVYNDAKAIDYKDAFTFLKSILAPYATAVVTISGERIIDE